MMSHVNDYSLTESSGVTDVWAARLLVAGTDESNCFAPRLRQSGKFLAQSGVVESPAFAVHFHSGLGSMPHDKARCQDCIVAWNPTEPYAANGLSFAVAIADGLGSSARSDIGARLACFSALELLISQYRSPPPDEDRVAANAVPAFNAALGQLSQAMNIVRATPTLFAPAKISSLAWNKAVECRRLLQTTLCLAWIDGERMSIAAIGDFAVYRSGGGVDAVQFGGELDSNRTKCLTPGDSAVLAEHFDVCESFPVPGECVLGLMTDGVHRGLAHSKSTLFTVLSTAVQSAGANLAELEVNRLMEASPDDFQDDLTLMMLIPRAC